MEIRPRLKKIAELIPNGSTLADIGTDHAYLPVYCFQNNIIKSAIAMDINPMPLKRAESHLIKYGFLNRCELRLSNGLKELKAGEADIIVIAGMGGILIKNILNSSPDIIEDDTVLILQPMTAPIELRQFIFENGMKIDDEYVVREENKYYNIFEISKGKAEIDDEMLYIGKNLCKNSSECYFDYLKYKAGVCKKIIEGMDKSAAKDMHLYEKYKYEYNVYLKYLKG